MFFIPSSKKFKNRLKTRLYWISYKSGRKLSFVQLKALCTKAAQTGDNRDYDLLLRHFDPKITDFRHYTFKAFSRSDGLGQGTLNTFRIFTSSSNDMVFEKIYLKNSTDWVKSSYFLENHRRQLHESGISIPFISENKIGDTLVISKYSYIEITEDPIETHKSIITSCISKLSKLTPKSAALPNIDDFTLHPGFARRLLKIKKFSRTHNIPTDAFDLAIRRLESFPKFAAHGDLHIGNTSAPNIVFDWDCFGYYPPGFDIAFSLASFNTKISEKDIIEIAMENHHLYSRRCSLDDFSFSLFFFYLLYTKTKDTAFKINLVNSFLHSPLWQDSCHLPVSSS